MEKILTPQDKVARICTIQAHIMASMRLQCKILSHLTGRPFDELLKEASGEAVRITEQLFEMLPSSSEDDDRN